MGMGSLAVQGGVSCRLVGGVTRTRGLGPHGGASAVGSTEATLAVGADAGELAAGGDGAPTWGDVEAFVAGRPPHPNTANTRPAVPSLFTVSIEPEDGHGE